MGYSLNNRRRGSIASVPEFQRHIHVAAFTFNVVGIQSFRILTFQDAALAARLAVVQALPGFNDVRPSGFPGGLFYKRWSHGFILSFRLRT